MTTKDEYREGYSEIWMMAETCGLDVNDKLRLAIEEIAQMTEELLKSTQGAEE